ncbi:MAG: DUF3179 domain-containing protein [Alphaproteobacteria bacterium]
MTVIARDQIPAINDPVFRPASDDVGLAAVDPVVALVMDGVARAYPLRIMMWHEIVNDVVDGRPITVTYCPLCNSAIVFDATVDGLARDFGTTGKLRFSDLVMYDRQSHTWWQQFSGEGLIGKYAGERLTMIPSRLESWEQFKTAHPDGEVLVPNDSRMRQYWRNPYSGYDTAPSPFLFRGALPEGIPAMERVVLVRAQAPFAIALPLLQERGEIREGDIVVRWQAGQASALDAAEIVKGRDVGTVSVTDARDGAPVVHDVTFAFVVNAFEPTLVVRTQ